MADNDAPGAWPIWTPGPHGFREDFLKIFSYYNSLEANDPRGLANLDPRGMMAGFKKGTTKHCFILNI